VKVTWWLPELPPDPGGIGSFAAIVGPALGERGHELHFLVTQGGPSYEAFGSIPVRRLPVRESLDHGATADMLAHRRSVADHKRATAPDLYHVHLCEPSPVLHLSTANVAPAPLVLTLHNEMFQRLRSGGGDTLIGRLADSAAVIVTVSVGSANDLLDERPDVADRLVVAPNGTTIGASPTTPPTEPMLLAMGRLVPQKGFDRLIRALPSVRARLPATRVVVAGEGPERGNLERLAAQLGCSDMVEFVGHIDHSAVPSLFDAARVVAMPSRHEGMPFVALEAGERGRAVVGAAVGGIDEVVDHDVTGLLVPAPADEQTDTLADALVRALSEPGLAERLSTDACAETYEVAYRVAAPGPRPRVSVIIPAWNAEHLIGETIASVRAQTFTDLEIIVVDDGSTDGTAHAARAAGGPDLVVLRQPHRGIGASRNAGLAVSRGEVFAHLDADDLWPAHRLQQLLNSLDAQPGLEAVFGRAVEFADADAPPTATVVTDPQAVRMATAGILTRAAQRRHGPFHARSSGDQLTWAGRALHNGLRYAQIDDVVLHRRIHANNNSHRFPFLTDKNRVNLVRDLLLVRRAQGGVGPG
jgi:glycogen synthase